MKIAAHLNSINKEKWIAVVNSNEHLIPLHEYYHSESAVYDSAILKVDNVPYGRIIWNWDSNDCSIEVEVKYLPNVYRAILSIAEDLGGQFYIKKNEIFNTAKHLPRSKIEIKREKRYFENDDLDFIRWLAIRDEEQASVLKTLELKVSSEISLKGDIDSDQLIVTPPYSGWTFIIGNNLPDLLVKGDENSTEEALTKLCKSLQLLSKEFVEVQYYEYQGKSNINGYFKANKGKLNFGYWKSETEEFVKGVVPKDIKKLHPASAHEVASVWSVDPLDFAYIKEMAEKKASVVVWFPHF